MYVSNLRMHHDLTTTPPEPVDFQHLAGRVLTDIMMEVLLEFDRPFNPNLFDRVVAAFYTSSGEERTLAQQVLTRFQEHPDAWTRVPDIVKKTKRREARFIALQILEKLITTRWKSIPGSQKQGIRNFVVEVTINAASDERSLRKEKVYINKLNIALVQILKQEWPHNWPTFIPDLVASSMRNFALCENNMVILKLLSEEIFDFSAEQMTQSKINNLKSQMCDEFSGIFKLCSDVLEQSPKSPLIHATLETMLRFLNWIPLGYVFETHIIDLLITRFLETPEFRNVTLKCLTEITMLDVGPEYNSQFATLFAMVMTSMNRMVPPTTDIAQAYANARDDGQTLILNLALFLTNFLSKHVRFLEREMYRDVLLIAHLYLVKISQVEEREVFRICLEYWLKLVGELYEEGIAKSMRDGSQSDTVIRDMTRREGIYADVLSDLRLVAVTRMVKPEEVLIVENEEGEIVREFVKETDTILLYKDMRELLVYLTHLDIIDTEALLQEKLEKQMDGSEWSWNNLNTLCWAVGSISGAMDEETEKGFLIHILKELLVLTDMKHGKDNKAVVASGIMYIVGQYPRFLKAHWKFLKTVVQKLFEFMHESHDGVQDMACDTFLKIAQKCKRHFAMQQPVEQEPFVEEILLLLHNYTSELSAQQVHTFYEAVGYMISAQPNKPQQAKWVAKLMELPNNAWDSLMSQAANDVDVLGNLENVMIISNILKTNVAACSSIGSSYISQIGRIFLDMLGLYRAVGGIISETVSREGTIATKKPAIRQLRIVKKEILKLMETYIKIAEDLDTVNANFIPTLLDSILGDYSTNSPMARDAEVLNVMATIIGRLGQLLTPQVPAILGAVFQQTLDMITRDFTEYPEHRVGFYRLLRDINLHCFPALLSVSPSQFKLFMDSIIWGIKHTMRDIAELALNLCLEVIDKFCGADPAISNAFFQQYYLSVVQDIYFVLTDTDHKSGFRLQSQLLARLYQLVETNRITSPLFDPASVSDLNVTNALFMRGYTMDLLKAAFPHVQNVQVQTFVNAIEEYHSDSNQFKLALRDFLIQLKEFSGDNADLFLDEKEAQAQEKAQQEREAAMRIPGMLKPSQMEDKDEEL